MTTALNVQVRLKSRPNGIPQAEHFELAHVPVPELAHGQFLVRNEFLSVEPAMRGWVSAVANYAAPVGIGEVMRAIAVGRVVASRDERFLDGDHVSGMLGIQEYAIVDADGLQKIDPSVAPLPKWLDVLGMPGLTAYFGLLDIGRPEPGQTVVVSGAAGAVGGLVGQLAKLQGARAVGIAGGAEKCHYVTGELGFDAAIDYKNEDVPAALRRACPNGIDVYFDNVGGEILDAALARLAFNARVVICGAISQYNSTEGIRGPANYMSLLVNHASMTGFLVFHYASRYAEGARQMGEWVAAGKLKSREDVVDGIENFPGAFLKLFEGTNDGKLVLAVRRP
jgi:NADPH-dependent curcumin reductase CurA